MFTDFHFEGPSALPPRPGGHHGRGTRADDGHLWIAEAAIRHWLVGLTDDLWDEGFSGMVAYARSKGWTDEAGTHLRAHVETSTERRPKNRPNPNRGLTDGRADRLSNPH
ncbi:MAG: hypothetical protein Ct9H300mP31_20650 [Acidimicrobiaceae bacterium]|nr:MAG: hypothetical protein Ct9H300mP31_20650 [Acidimicrobiaceae bacterium]